MKFAFANEADHILAELSLKDYVVTSHNNEDIKKRNNGSRILLLFTPTVFTATEFSPFQVACGEGLNSIQVNTCILPANQRSD